jgi:hypothetical protein
MTLKLTQRTKPLHIFTRLLPFLLAAFLYTWTVRLPFFSDDVLHFRYATQVQTLDIWTKPDITGIYYRPVVNFILHVSLNYAGVPLSAPIWHTVILWNHLLNIALVGALAHALRLKFSGQVIAMLIFAAFPFNAQAVVWVLAWFHPLAATAVLGFCVMGLKFFNHRGTKGTWLIAAWLIGGIAPFIHENGVLAVPLMGWLVLCLYGVRGTFSRWKKLALVMTPPLLFALLYFVLRQVLFPPAPASTPLGTYLVENLAAFAQGISFPLQFLAALLPFGDGVTKAWIGFIAFIFLCILLYFSAVSVVLNTTSWRFNRILAGAGWWALASLPAALALTPIYVELSERLLYITAAGVALVYGAMLGNGKRAQYIAPLQVIRGITLITILALSVGFIAENNRLFAALGSGYREMSALLRDADDVPTLLVNMPQQVDSNSYIMPLTREHAFMLHDYLALRDFVWLNTGREFSELGAIVYPDILDTWDGYSPHFYTDGDLTIAQSNRVILFRLIDGQYTAQLVGERTTSSNDVVADFSNVRLASVSFAQEGNQMRVGLRWQRLDAAPLFYVIFAHLLCGEAIISQSDGAPVANLYDFSTWQVNETWMDYRYMDVNDTPADCLALRVGLYRRDDGTRATATDSSGNIIGEWVIIPFESSEQ